MERISLILKYFSFKSCSPLKCHLLQHLLLILTGKPVKGSKANPADPDQMPHNVASDQGLHCLLPGFSIKKENKSDKIDPTPVVSYWLKHEVLVNRLGGLSLPRKSVVRLTDRPDMTLDVYRGRKTTIQQQDPTPPK